MQLIAFFVREGTEQLALGDLEDLQSARMRGAPRVREHGQARSPIGRVGGAADEAVGLEPIDELRDVRLHAREPIRELPEREGAAGFGEPPKRGELREREAHFAEPRFDATLEGAGGVQHGEQPDTVRLASI